MESKKLSFNTRYIGREILRHWPIYVVPSIIYLLSITGTVGTFTFSENAYEEVSKDVVRGLMDVSGVISFIMGLVASYAAFGFLGSKKKHYFFEFLHHHYLFVDYKYVYNDYIQLLPMFSLHYLDQ